MKNSFEHLMGQIGVLSVVGKALMKIGGIAGVVMTAVNIIFGFISGLTTVCGTILVFCAVIGILCEMMADGLAEYIVETYPDEAEKAVNESK